MPKPVIMGATLTCSFGTAPSTLIVAPADRVSDEQRPAASILDHKPMVNIPPFGMCSSPANPAVATATAAALGVLTPMPCVPVIPAPWAPGSPTILINSKPALNHTSKCMCTWAGVIQVANPGATTTDVP